ncbi:MAG: glutamine-hydrolyzing carbamoyl-phosphate synthase small subunit [Thermaurantimonas sp.]|uniref:glutamine-hydrolyzing carbamoyl-phosphate synthase small subunit n=1 Tax=Thermaurantimonas sp. TaxID=2681568 RepID=UPI00391CF2D1
MISSIKPTAAVVLEDGTVFFGRSIGIEGETSGELCFNTGMTGYQEIFTDPSYYGQLMVMASVHIGNYGVREDESESNSLKISGLICRNFTNRGSRPAMDQELKEFFKKHKTIAIAGVDTRALVQHIRDFGAQNAVVSTDISNLDDLKKKAKAVPTMAGLELSSKVTCSEPYYYGNPAATYKVAALDMGIKQNILRCLAERDVYVKVFPLNTSFEEFTSWPCDGYFFSNGPGDPAAMPTTAELVKRIIDLGKPVFGICLGHQIIGLSQGLETFKMHHGHRGINHPVMKNSTGKGEITSQNHGFAVKSQSLPNDGSILLTHNHLNDHTVAGIKLKDKPVFSVQYHPESAPGPHDSRYLFDEFVNLLKQYKS